MATSINPREIENFSKDSARWWDENGPFRPLHRLNPVRLEYICGQIRRHYGCDVASLRPFGKLSILDIGCGGGLVCEPLARLGAAVTGIDADAQAVETAKEHARGSGLAIDYRCGAAEDLKQGFDVVLALEIVEHVNDPAAFVKNCVRLCKPGGLVVFSTLNRTAKSMALGIIAAEYVLRWVPRGTHDWKKFIRPSELARMIRSAGAQETDAKGLIFNPASGRFGLSSTDLAVNYLMTAERPQHS